MLLKYGVIKYNSQINCHDGNTMTHDLRIFRFLRCINRWRFKFKFSCSQTTLSSNGCVVGGCRELDVWFVSCALVSVPSTKSHLLVILQQA